MGTTRRNLASKVLSIAALFGAMDNKKDYIDLPTKRGGGAYGGGRVSAAASDAVIFIPQRKKLKGYQVENRKSTFNKNR